MMKMCLHVVMLVVFSFHSFAVIRTTTALTCDDDDSSSSRSNSNSTSSCKQAGSALFPISASAELGALGNVTLYQAKPNEPVRINVTYDDTSRRAMVGAFKVRISAEPLARADAGTTQDECRGALTTLHDPEKRAPPFVSLVDYAKGCRRNDEISSAAADQQCARGDLSGKHGLLPAPSGTRTLEDTSLQIHDIIGRAFVIENVISRTVACANIVMDVDDDDDYKNMPRLVEEAPSETTRALSSPPPSSSSSSRCSVPAPRCTSGHELGELGSSEEDGSSLRILGGTEAKRGAYPWIVNMGVCSGTLIAPSVVLTAAHCVAPFGPIRLGQVVMMGCHSLSGQTCQESGRITGIFPHEKYTDQQLDSSLTDDGKPRAKFAYDVAILILEKQHRTPVATIATREDDPAYCEKSASTVAGWGVDATGRRYASSVLLEVEVPVVSHERCEEAWGKGRIGSTMICAGFDDGGCDACQGDSGGPIFTSTRCAPPGTPPRVFGITSWGSKCDKEDRKPYGVYTSVASVRDWIASKMPSGDQLAELDERVLPYVVRAINQTASDNAFCGVFDESRCSMNVVAGNCPKLCRSSCPLVRTTT